MVQHRTEMPNRLRHWYEQTQNPLYVWEAIAEGLNADEPSIPDWCIPYLREAAVNLTHLAASVRDIREDEGASSDHAMQSVSQALSLSRQGKRNAFANLPIDRRDADEAWHSLTDHPIIAPFIHKLGLKWIEEKRNVSRDRAQRIIARGTSLLRLR